MKRVRLTRAIAVAVVAVVALSAPVAAADTENNHYRKLTSTMDNYTISSTFTHSGGCWYVPTWAYRVQMRVKLGAVTSTSFVVDEMWITYTPTKGTVWSQFFYIHGSYERWPTSGEKYQLHYITAPNTRTYHYDVNKTFRKDATLENRSFYSDPNTDDCREVDQWSLYLY